VEARHPDQAFSQRSMPWVAVLRPRMTEEEPWGRDYVRRVYGVTVLAIDAYRPTPEGIDEVIERLDLMAEKIKAVMQREENRNLGLAFLHVFRSLVEWTEGEVMQEGNNLAVKPIELSVPMVVERGKVWQPEVVLVTELGQVLTTEANEALTVEVGN
jgi:hypothetical protein